jgi:hypothetical protein
MLMQMQTKDTLLPNQLVAEYRTGLHYNDKVNRHFCKNKVTEAYRTEPSLHDSGGILSLCACYFTLFHLN